MTTPDAAVSEITAEDVGRIQRTYGIPPDVILRPPRPEHRVSQDLERGVFIYEDSLKAGLRLPLHPLVREIMASLNICPTMVAPNSWRSIIGFISMCHQIQVVASLPLFHACYHLVPGRKSEWPYVGPRRSFKTITDKPSSIKGWKGRFFIADGNIGPDFPRVWGNVARDAGAHLVLTAQEERDLDRLRNGRVFSANDLLSEEALFAAGLSPLDPRAKKSDLSGRVRKRPSHRSGASGGEGSRPEKKARVSVRSPPSAGVATADTPAAGEGLGKSVDIPCPPVFEISDSSDETPSARPITSPPKEEPTAGSEEAVVGEVRGEPAVEGVLASELGGGEVEPPVMVQEEDRAEASAGPAGEAQASVAHEEEPEPEPEQEVGRSEDVVTGASPVKILGRLAVGLAALSEEGQARILLAEATKLTTVQPEVAQAGTPTERGQPSSSGATVEEAFSALMRSALYPGAGPSADEFADLELVDAAFGQRGAVESIHLLPDIDNPTLMKLARAYASRVRRYSNMEGDFLSACSHSLSHFLQNLLISRALCWRLSLAAGASVQARRASSELRARAEASDRFEKLLDENTENLKRMRALFETARKEASEQKQKVEELQALLAKTDDACLELARVKSKHAEEMEAVRSQHGETLNRLRREADAERSRLNGMLGEVEERLKRRDRDVADMSANIQWQ